MNIEKCFNDLKNQRSALNGAIEKALKMPVNIKATQYIKSLYEALIELRILQNSLDDKINKLFPEGEAMIEGAWIYETDKFGDMHLTLDRNAAVMRAEMSNAMLKRYQVKYDEYGSKYLTNIQPYKNGTFEC